MCSNFERNSMNTISSVSPYANLRNNSQISKTHQAPAFKGQIGKRVVEEISYKKPLTIASILAMVGGMIGLSKDKVSDVMEELINKIKSLMGEKAELEQQNLELKKTLVNIKSEKDIAMKNFEAEKQQMQAGITHALVEKDLEIKEKDSRIAELEKYEAMAKVKSVEDLDIVTPEQFLELLEEAKDAQPRAEASLLNYLFNGNGQEEFLAQMERNNQILKAIIADITNMEDLKKAYENIGIIIGQNPAYVVQEMMIKVLKNDEMGLKLLYPPIREQVEINADAIINSMMNNQRYNTPNKKLLDEVVKFYTDLSNQTKNFESTNNFKFESRKKDRDNNPYYTFSHEDGRKIDIYLTHLASHKFDVSRTTHPDGTVIDMYGCYKNL